MASAVSICNMALARIGVRKQLESLDQQGSTEAALCNAMFEPLRDQVLAASDWPFARRRAFLAQVTGVTRTGWSFVYQLPADCLEARVINPSQLPIPFVPRWGTCWTQPILPMPRIPFRTEAGDPDASGNVSTRILLCNASPAELAYTAQITAEPLFSPLFSNTLSWLLALELSMALAVRPDLRAQATTGCQVALSQARAAAYNEGYEPEPMPEFLAARY